MAQTVISGVQLPEEIGRLASDTTEIGIVVGDMFRYACAGLFGSEPEAARFAIESRAWVASASATLDRRVRAIIHQFNPSGDDLSHIVELQHAVSQYCRVADHANRIAELALRLAGSCDDLLRATAPDAPEMLYTLISLVYEQIRRAFLVTAARDAGEARTILADFVDVENYHRALQVRLEHGIKVAPQFSTQLMLIVIITTAMRQIGEAVVTICQTTL
jgi:phosphate uptake regulator